MVRGQDSRRPIKRAGAALTIAGPDSDLIFHRTLLEYMQKDCVGPDLGRNKDNNYNCDKCGAFACDKWEKYIKKQ